MVSSEDFLTFHVALVGENAVFDFFSKFLNFFVIISFIVIGNPVVFLYFSLFLLLLILEVKVDYLPVDHHFIVIVDVISSNVHSLSEGLVSV